MSRVPPLPLPTPSEVEDWRWIDEHMTDLVHRYPDQWVAVQNGVVLAAGAAMDEVARAAETKCQSYDIVLEFIHSGTRIF